MMKALNRVIALLGLAGAALTAPLALADYGPPEAAPGAIASAKSQAKDAKRAVLLVFGADWCKDCRVLEAEMTKPELAARLAARYQVVKVNVGRFDRNTDLAERYGVPLKKGIPALAVIAPDDQVLAATAAGELASARSMSSQGISTFLLGLPQAK